MEDTFFKNNGMTKDGDVLVRLSLTNSFHVHSSVLRRSSAFFRDLLEEKFAVNPTPKARSNGLTTRYLVELVDSVQRGRQIGRLERMEIDNHGRFVSDNGKGRCTFDIENGKEQAPIIKHYLNMFGAFYNRPLDLKEDSIAAILQDVFWLLEIAEYVGSVSLIAKPIEITLLKHGQVLLKSISQAPIAWIDLAYRIKSEMLFKESVIHIVGKWNLLTDEQKKGMRDNVKELCVRKHKELRYKSCELERKIFAIYPASLQRGVNDINGRASYANDIMMWMALNFFRHWYGHMITSGEGHNSKDSGYQFYTLLGSAGSAYLDRPTLNSYFFGRFSMTKKGQSIIENNMLEIKDLVKMTVVNTKLLQVNTQLDLSRNSVNWITSTQLEDNEYPWLHSSLSQDVSSTILVQANARALVDNGDEDSVIDSIEDFLE